MNLNIRDFRGRTNALILLALVTIAVILLPPIDAIENANLTARMLECALVVFYSVALGYGLDRLRNGKQASPRPKSWYRSFLFGGVIPGIALAFWNFPPTFDLTVANVGLRYASDFTYIGAGILVGMTVPMMPRAFRAGMLLLTFLSVGMMGSMMLVWQPGFYTAYSPAQNLDSNTFLLGIGALGVLISGSWTMKIMDIV